MPYQLDLARKVFNDDREAGCQYVHELPLWRNHVAEE